MLRTPPSRSTSFVSRFSSTLLVLGSAALLAFGCSESGSEPEDIGGGPGPVPQPEPEPEPEPATTGTISIFVTDAPSDDFDEINITLEEIEFLGNGAPVTIFEGEATIDLKSLEDFSDLFTVAEDVPAGQYSKIRLRVTGVELVDYDGSPETIDLDPPANGKIDLNPQGPFDVRAGEHVVVEIDMDAGKSIHIKKKGKGKDKVDEYQFRPVVFVTIRDDAPPSKLSRVHGQVVGRLADGRLRLCPSIFAPTGPGAPTDDFSIEQYGAAKGLPCVLVRIDGRTGVFDANGDPAELDEVIPVDSLYDDAGPAPRASAVTVIGHFVAESREERETDPYAPMHLLAAVIEEGQRGTFLQLKGWVYPYALDGDPDLLPFLPDEGQGFGEETWLDALLQDGTRIFDRAGNEYFADEIEAPGRGLVDGVFGTTEPESDLLYKTSLIVYEEPPMGAPDGKFPLPPIDAVIGWIDHKGKELELIRDDESVVFEVEKKTEVFFAYEGEDEFVNRSGKFDELETGMHVQLFAEGEDKDPPKVKVLRIVSFTEPSDD